MRLSFIVLLSGWYVSAYALDNEAQLNDSLTTVHTMVLAPNHSHFEIYLSYQTDDVYSGRKNSTIIPLVTPRISYIFKNGLQFDASAGYDLNDPSQQTNQYIFDGTYNFSPGNGNYSSSVTIPHLFIINKVEALLPNK
jgi:hypothetical protein